jgi:hypothetical protein
MNHVERSLELISQFTEVKSKQFGPINWKKLREQKLVFHNLNTKEITETLPEEAAIVDFEWLVETGMKRPFYVWFGDSQNLCSVGTSCKTFICHNIEADRPCILESYEQNTNLGPNFFCTMSAHLLVAGIGNQQAFRYQPGATKARVGGLKNLIDVFNFWSAETYPEVLDYKAKRGEAKLEEKEIRDIFLTDEFQVLNRLNDLMTYGFEDVDKVLRMLPSLHKAWMVSLPAKESQYFYLKRAKVNYSLSPEFHSWFENTEIIYQEKIAEVELKVKQITEQIQSEFNSDLESIKIPDVLPEDFYTKSKVPKLKKKYENKNIIIKELDLAKQVVAKYTKLFPDFTWQVSSAGAPLFLEGLTSKSPAFQLLLSPTFRDNPIFYSREIGFFYREKDGTQTKVTSPKKGLNTKDNCGSIFSKDFMDYWEDGTFKVDNEIAKEVVKVMSEISYWISIRTRIGEIYMRTK